MRRAAFLSMNSAGSKEGISAAIFTAYSLVSKCSMSLTAERPATSPAKNSSRPKPSADTTPMPVTTTRWAGCVRSLAVMPIPPTALDAEAAVDRENDPGDEPGCISRQEGDGFRDVRWVAQAVQGSASGDGGFDFIGQRRRHLGLDVSRGHGVDPYPARSEFPGQRLRKPDQTRLGSGCLLY